MTKRSIADLESLSRKRSSYMVLISVRGPESIPQKIWMLSVASVITDPVTTTDELIPSGETSSLRSNPMKLAEYALHARIRDM